MQPVIFTNPRTQENLPYIVMETDDTLVEVSRHAIEIQAKSIEMSLTSALEQVHTEEEAQRIFIEADVIVTHHVQTCVMIEFAERNTVTDNPNTFAYPHGQVNASGLMRDIAARWIDGTGRN